MSDFSKLLFLWFFGVCFSFRSEGETLFFSVNKDLGGALVNKFPFGSTWSKPESNVSANLFNESVRKGGNQIELLFFVTEKGGSYVFQFEDEENNRIYDTRINTQWIETEEGLAGRFYLEWLVPTQEKKDFSFAEGEELRIKFSQAEDGGEWEYSETKKAAKGLKEGVKGLVVIELSFKSERGSEIPPPWLGAESYQTRDLSEVGKVGKKYLTDLAKKDYSGIGDVCDERWKWEAESYGVTVEDRIAVTKKSREMFRSFVVTDDVVSRVEQFPLTSLIRVSGKQLGVVLDGEALYLDMFLMKLNGKWKIIR